MNGKVLVTGGLGNLGSWITRELSNSNFEVYVLTRKTTYKIKDVKYKTIEADICDISSLENNLNIEFDYCIHTASMNEYYEDDYATKAIEVNALGTRNLLEILSRQNLKKFIYLSTFHVYGAANGLVREESDLNPKNDYAITHLFAEYYIKQFAFTHSINYTIFRLTNSYGCPIDMNTNKWYLVLNNLVQSAYHNKVIKINTNGNATRDFIWMGDVVDIVKKSLDFKNNDTYNLSANKSYKIIEIANLVKDVYESKYNKQINIEINNDDKNIYESLEVDNSKLNRVLGELIVHDELTTEIKKIFDLLGKINE